VTLHERRGQLVLTGKKLCTNCQTWQDLAAFPPNRRLASGLSSWCRPCHAEATARWRERHPGYDRRYRAARRAEQAAAAAAEAGQRAA
jgi:hypothetical protein